MVMLVLSLCLNTLAQDQKIKVEKIWDKAPHNAFTDLIRFKNTFYCTFREGSGHIPGTNGKIRILKSSDGHKWTNVVLLEKTGFDLRDPSLSITPQGKLMVLMGGSVYENGKLLSKACQVSFYNDSTHKFSDPIPVKYDQDTNSDSNWLWRVIWHDKVAYGVVYYSQSTTFKISLVTSVNGINYSLVKSFEIDGKPNETSLRFMPDGKLFILVRREDQNQYGLLGRSTFPFKEWDWVNTGFKLGGPDLIITPEGTLIIGTRTFSKNGTRTGLLSIDSTGKFKLLIEFPSGGDTGYPGMVIYKNTLFISYYSSHEGKTSIYLAQIPMTKINRLIGDNATSPFK